MLREDPKTRVIAILDRMTQGEEDERSQIGTLAKAVLELAERDIPVPIVNVEAPQVTVNVPEPRPTRTEFIRDPKTGSVTGARQVPA